MPLTHVNANWTQALADLREAPAKPRGAKSLRQALEGAIDDIISCRERGHTDSDIVAIFAQNGIKMSLHTFRQYVRQALRVKAEQASGVKGRTAHGSKAQTRNIRGNATVTSPPEAPDVGTIRAAVQEAQRTDTPVTTSAKSRSDGLATRISQTVVKPPVQSGKTAAEVLGHRFDEDV